MLFRSARRFVPCLRLRGGVVRSGLIVEFWGWIWSKFCWRVPRAPLAGRGGEGWSSMAACLLLVVFWWPFLCGFSGRPWRRGVESTGRGAPERRGLVLGSGAGKVGAVVVVLLARLGRPGGRWCWSWSWGWFGRACSSARSRCLRRVFHAVFFIAGGLPSSRRQAVRFLLLRWSPASRNSGGSAAVVLSAGRLLYGSAYVFLDRKSVV